MCLSPHDSGSKLFVLYYYIVYAYLNCSQLNAQHLRDTELCWADARVNVKRSINAYM